MQPSNQMQSVRPYAIKGNANAPEPYFIATLALENEGNPWVKVTNSSWLKWETNLIRACTSLSKLYF